MSFTTYNLTIFEPMLYYMRNLKLHVVLLAFLTVFTPAYAAAPANLQNTVEQYDPGKAASELSEQPINQSTPPPTNVVNIKGNQAPPPTDQTTLNVKFRLKKIILTGNTIFSTAELSKLYADKLNTDVSLADLEAIAQKITEYYRKAGYVLTQTIIPPQEINQDGIVRIKIIEGYVKKISVTGCKSDTACNLLHAYGDRIRDSMPLKLNILERFSFLASDIPGTKVHAVITPSQDSVGAADLTFIVQETRFGGYVAFNDYNPEVLGLQQFIGNVRVNNISTASETALNGIISRNSNRMRYGSFTHKQQLNSNGLGGRISISSIATQPDMGSVGLGGLDIPGNAFIVNVNLDYAWLRSHNKNLYIGTAFKFLNSTTEFGGETLFKDNIRSIQFYVSYNFLQSATYNSIIITLSQGLKIFNAQGNPPSRIGEDLTFTKLDLYASSSHKFMRTKFSTFLAIKGQYAFNLLPSSETFNYGGIPFGYGYDPSEFSGDRGIAGIFELQYPTYAIPNCNLISQIFAFVDSGFVWDINAIPPTYQYGVSTGIGHRINMLKHVNIDLAVGVPLKPSTIEGEPNFVRLLFNLKLYA